MILELKRLPILETERLRLEPLVATDADLIFPIVDDPEVMADWDNPEIDDPDVVARIVLGQVEAMAAGRALHWAARTLAEDRFLGSFELPEIDRNHRRAEVGFTLDRETWEAGYPLEGLRTIIAFAAANGLRKLTARTHLGHRRSEALVEALGFKEEGLLRGSRLKDGQRRDGRLFGLTL